MTHKLWKVSYRKFLCWNKFDKTKTFNKLLLQLMKNKDQRASHSVEQNYRSFASMKIYFYISAFNVGMVNVEMKAFCNFHVLTSLNEKPSYFKNSRKLILPWFNSDKLSKSASKSVCNRCKVIQISQLTQLMIFLLKNYS